jgi:hypothetical protein
MEALEARCVLAAIFPAYVEGVFSLGDANSPDGAPYGLENTFLLSSIPTASKTIYLDFDGHHSVNNSWGHDILFEPYNTQGTPDTFTDAELVEIQKLFQNVAEDFLPFNVNVTTADPGVDAIIKNGFGDTQFGVRAVNSQEPPGFCGCGGVAFIGSFGDRVDNPVFAFNKGVNSGGMTISHELGHALGLNHDGLNSNPYHPGTGTGETGWGPIMGAPFGKYLSQWSKGEYSGANNLEDDFAIITGLSNGFGFRPDDHGNSTATATQLTPTGTSIFAWGIIEMNTDVDFFEFTTAAGEVTIDIDPFGGGVYGGQEAESPNLDIELKLYDGDGGLIASDNLLTQVDASLSLSLAAGTYYFSIDGVGRPDRYTDYGSVGFYQLNVTIPETVIDGDFNDDGKWDILDLDALIQNIALGPRDPETYDLTGDGFVDLQDRDAWLAEAGAINLPSGMPYLLADANLDGGVDGLDYAEWNANKFTTTGLWSKADFNADNFTDGLDFGIWNDHKFMSSGNLPKAGSTDTAHLAPGHEAFSPRSLNNGLPVRSQAGDQDHGERAAGFSHTSQLTRTDVGSNRTRLAAQTEESAVPSGQVAVVRNGVMERRDFGYGFAAKREQARELSTQDTHLWPDMVDEALSAHFPA